MVTLRHRVGDLRIETLPGLGREGNRYVVACSGLGALHVLRERHLVRLALLVAPGEELLEHPEPVVAHQLGAAHRYSHLLYVCSKGVEVMGLVETLLALHTTLVRNVADLVAAGTQQ